MSNDKIIAKSGTMTPRKIATISGLLGLITILLSLIGGPIIRPLILGTLGIQTLGVYSFLQEVIGQLGMFGGALGQTINYHFYKSNAAMDYQKSKNLLAFFQKLYFIIGVATLFLVIMMSFFLPSILKENINTENIYLIYFGYSLSLLVIPTMFLGNRILLWSDHRVYRNEILGVIFTISNFIFQIIALIFFKTFESFIFALCLNSILAFTTIIIYSQKFYPEVNTLQAIRLPKKEKKLILKYGISGLIVTLRNLVVSATDNTLIAIFINIKTVAIYANYFTLTMISGQFIGILLSSLTPLLGKISAETTDKFELLRTFKIILLGQTFFMMIFLNGMNICLPPFMTIWMGPGLTINRLDLTLMLLVFFLNTSQNAITITISANGLLNKVKLLSIIEVIINLVTSLLLAGIFNLGLTGILLGTIIANLSTTLWWAPWIIYKYKFNTPLLSYFKDLIIYILPGAIVMIITSFISQEFVGWFTSLNVLIEFLIKGFGVTVLTIIAYIISLRKLDEYKYLESVIKDSIEFGLIKLLKIKHFIRNKR
jgi:O-antigen/teichoic acid export membrane protein